MTYTVVATDKVSESGLGHIVGDDRFYVLFEHDSASESFVAALSGADALIVRSATTVDTEMLAGAPNLKVIGRAGVGVDNIDIPAATRRGIAVVNAPFGNTIAAAEMTMALILATMRHVVAADASLRAGKWDRASFQGSELLGRRLGLIGAGRIGREVATRCQSFGMDVIIYDPYLSEDRAEEIGCRLTDLDEVVHTADVISLHVPLTDETWGIINRESISMMKAGTYVINASRGGVVVESDLADALESGHLGGAALDVYEEEPLGEGSPLRNAPRLTLTPHLGASTAEAQVHVAVEVAANVAAVLVDGDLATALNRDQLVN
ncbi:MAG TPA: hydroxyacid dehydrogenase [Acidimicrobiia bacterium]|nr:hydroxyacid dehydrogenase [Acidimicrobiia bacterium]